MRYILKTDSELNKLHLLSCFHTVSDFKLGWKQRRKLKSAYQHV